MTQKVLETDLMAYNTTKNLKNISMKIFLVTVYEN